jgi:hypothetical protein
MAPNTAATFTTQRRSAQAAQAPVPTMATAQPTMKTMSESPALVSPQSEPTRKAILTMSTAVREPMIATRSYSAGTRFETVKRRSASAEKTPTLIAGSGTEST